VNDTRWSRLRVRLEILRDLVAWFAVAVLAVGLVCSYASVQDLRRDYAGQSFHAGWYRYINAAVSGAGIPLVIAGLFVSVAILLTAGVRVADAFGDEDEDDEYDNDDDGVGE
jgi:hypothetical protein